MDQSEGLERCAKLHSPHGADSSFISLDKAPSHASRLACQHFKTVLHGTVDFNERDLQTSLPLSSFSGTSSGAVSFSILLLPISQNWRHSRPACITERGQVAVGCARKWAKLWSADSRSALPLKGALLIPKLTLHGTHHGYRRHHRHRQYASRTRISGSLISNRAGSPIFSLPKTTNFKPLGPYCVNNCAANDGKHTATTRERATNKQ